MAAQNDTMERLNHFFQPVMKEYLASPALASLAAGTLKVDEYREIVREVYHFDRETPQIHAVAASYFHGRERDLVRLYFQHATSEVGHDELALNDFVTLGGDGTTVPYENPLPATTALIGYAYHQIQRLNPAGFLGYLYFLEFIATSSGGAAANWLRNVGVPDNALSFLLEHIEVDVTHNRLMERYVESVITTEAAFEAACHAMRTTGYLYGEMMSQAAAFARAPYDRGWNYQELAADQLTPAEVLARRDGEKAVA